MQQAAYRPSWAQIMKREIAKNMEDYCPLPELRKATIPGMVMVCEGRIKQKNKARAHVESHLLARTGETVLKTEIVQNYIGACSEKCPTYKMLKKGRLPAKLKHIEIIKLKVKPREVWTGRRYGQWTVIDEPEKIGRYKKALCRCSCGNERHVSLDNLTRKISTRCRSCASKEIHNVK